MSTGSGPAPTKPDLVALVGSRIVHDLANPIGAIANGVELLTLTGGGPGPEQSLIEESVAEASARIKAFRIAFGVAQTGQMLSDREIAAALPVVTARGAGILWPRAGEAARRDVKMVFLALMCLETAMPWGGEIRVQEDRAEWRISAMADRFQDIPELWDALAAGRDVAIDRPAQVQFALIAAEARSQHRQLAVTATGEQIVIRF